MKPSPPGDDLHADKDGRCRGESDNQCHSGAPGPGTGSATLSRERTVPKPLPTLAAAIFALLYASHEGLASPVAGFRVESPSGAVVAGSAEAELAPGPDGALSQMAAIDLTAIPPGLYAVVVSARDEVAGRTVETRALFRVAPRPGTAAVEETVAEPGNDMLERVRGYIVGWGEGSREP